VTFAPPALPAEPAAQATAAGAGLILLVLAALLAGAAPARVLPKDPDEQAVRLAPDALGASVRPLAYLANPGPALRAAWRLLERSSEGLRLLMGLFEQRYYLLGVLAALITIMLLMAQ
jgi:hypothetical protein